MKKILFIFPFFFCGLLNADVLPSDVKEEVLSDFSGGLNTAVNKGKVPKNFATNLRNVLFDEVPGSLVQRNGYIVAGSTSVLIDIRFLFTFYNEDGSKEFLVSDSSIVLSTKDWLNYVMVSSGLNRSVNLQAVQVRKKVWFSNGSDPVFTWDGTVRTVLDGNNGNPNVPKGKYIGYYQNRVFTLNTISNGSDLSFCDVVTTAALKIAPDDSRAWPTDNSLSIGRGDGQIGTGLIVNNGQLYVFKERSIYKIFGTSKYNYTDVLIEPKVGTVSQDSIKVLDGNIYFLSNDGIYKMVNGQAIRISDLIYPDVLTFKKDSIKFVSNIWETQSDFAKGQFFGSTSTLSGLLTTITKDFTINTAVSDEASLMSVSSSTVSNGVSVSTVAGTNFLNFSANLDDSFLGYVKSISVYAKKGEVTSSCTARMTIYNLRTGNSESAVKDIEFGSGGGGLHTFDFNTQNVLFSGVDVKSSSFGVKIEYAGGVATLFSIAKVTDTNRSSIVLNHATTCQFISEVSTITNTITAWSTFDSVRETNGGLVNYFFRSSTSSVNITTQVWSAISPGANISAPTINNYIQLAATITSISTYTNITLIDNVSIVHIEGAGSNTRAFSSIWRNRFWMAVSTESTGNYPLIYVKSRITNALPDAWVVFDNIPIRSFTKNGEDIFYAGSSTAPVVFRLDYGTNDNGIATDAYWETPDLYLGSMYMNKQIVKYLFMTEKQSGGSLSIGTSNEGSDYDNKTFSLDGTGRLLQVVEGVKSQGKFYRFRFRNNSLDKGMTLHNFSVLYQPTQVLK